MKKDRTAGGWLSEPAATVDGAAAEAARRRQQQLTKPPGSLGELEDLAVTLAGLQGRERPRLERVRVGVFAADHGVAAEGVSAFPQAVTAEMVRNFSRGGAAISVLCRHLGAELGVINVGTVTELEPLAAVVDRRLAAGTANLLREPAMTPEQYVAALAVGRDWVDADVDCELIIGGEMGIGNTTAAAAVAAALTGLPVAGLVGRGTGVDDAGLARKRRVVEEALARHGCGPDRPDEVLRCVGGLELVALAGAYVRAAQRGVAVLVDGFITTAAALAAVALHPGARPWLLFSHCSAEQGHGALLEALSARPLLNLNLRLGEASGAALALPLLQAALALHADMATFAEAEVSHG